MIIIKEVVMSDWKEKKFRFEKKDCRVVWKRRGEGSKELWVMMELDGCVFKGRVEFVGRKEVK
jgi:hypothetical protein